MAHPGCAARLSGGATVECGWSAASMDVFIGTFTNKSSKGIYRTRLDTKSGKLASPVTLVAEALQPSWLRWHPCHHDIMYCANEDRNKPGCSAYRVLPDGNLQLLNTVGTGAAGPTHFSVSPSGRHLAVANYGGGALTVIPIAEDGSLLSASTVIVHEGSGPNLKRQTQPHAHSANFDSTGRFIFCCDLSDYIVSLCPALVISFSCVQRWTHTGKRYKWPEWHVHRCCHAVATANELHERSHPQNICYTRSGIDQVIIYELLDDGTVQRR
eukprot:SAG31_NODE_1442_length_8325_cov_5.564916_10_plen_270_part_00